MGELRNPNGILDIAASQGVNASNAARFGSQCTFSFVTNALDLHLNLLALSEIELEFQVRDFGDETHPQDGIYFSDDAGLNFKKVFDFNFASVSGFQTYVLDVDELSIQSGLVLSNQFVIRFQQYDNADFNTLGDEDGMYLDNILITGNGSVSTWYADTDNDNFGDPDNPTQSLNQPTGFVANNLDCNDTNPTIYPNAPEICDGLDNNCQGDIDEGVLLSFYPDNDGDGFGDINGLPIEACTAPNGYVINNLDCDDSAESINPNAIEVCDGIDNNCDGQTDIGTFTLYYPDIDGDGFGDENSTPTSSCSPIPDFVADNTDCDDTNPDIYPGAPDILATVINEDCNNIGCTITGDLTFTTQSELDNFLNICTILDGNLTINGDNITDLSNLINLIEITGTVLIGDSTLTAIGNDILTNLEGLNSIERIGGDLIICENPMLASLNGFSSLQEVGGSIRVKNCEVLTEVNFVNITSIGGDFFFRNLPFLFDFTFPSISFLPGSCYIGECGITVFGSNITGQNAGFFSIGGDLFLVDNPNLERVEFPDLINLNGCLHIINNTVLVGDLDFTSLDTIGQDLVIMNMDSIFNLDIFENLTAVEGKVKITGNINLENVDGLSNLLHVAGDFMLMDNEVLSECCGIVPLIQANGVAGQTTISDNPAGCGSELDILINCLNDISIECPANITIDCVPQSSGATVSWLEPTAITTCSIDGNSGLMVEQTGGPDNGSFLNAGASEVITYTATDDCNNTTTCSFTVTVNNNCTPCPTGEDQDEDGVCADVDCDDTNPNIPTTPGTSCDDGDATTFDDIIQDDGCTCLGDPQPEDCNIGFTIDDLEVTVTGLSDPHISILVLDIDNGWSTVFECFDTCDNPQLLNLPEGRYYIKVKTWDENWELLCEFIDFFELGPNLCGNVSDGGEIAFDESFESPYDPAPIVNIESPTGGSGSIEYLWLASTAGCPGVGDEVPNSNSPSYDPGPITQTTYYRRCSRIVGCTTYYESNCITKEVTGANPNCNIGHSKGPDFLTITGLNAEHADLKVFDSSWNLVMSCFDDCNATETISNLPNDTYYINAKLWNASWEVICEYGEYVEIDGTSSLVGQGDSYLFLNAVKDRQSVVLSWLTNKEEVNDFFSIERSSDNNIFTPIEKVNGENSDREDQHYKTLDFNPLTGDNFYRIKKVYTDGSYRYSASKKVHFDWDMTMVNLFPNPATSEIFLSIKDYAGRSAQLEIYNSLGVLMMTKNFESLPEEAIRFETEGFVGGVYSIRIKIDDLKQMNKLFIVNPL